MAKKMDGLKFGRDKIWHYVFIGAIGLVGLFLVYTIFLKQKSTATTNASGATVDSQGNPIPQYIPTSTTEENVTIQEGNTTTNTTNDPMTGSNNTGGTTVINPPPPAPPNHPIANPIPRPTAPPVVTQPVGAPPTQPHYATYTVKPGDTLSAIASRYGTTVANLFAINQSTIVSWANRHGNPIPGGPTNNIFPSEPILVPVHS